MNMKEKSKKEKIWNLGKSGNKKSKTVRAYYLISMEKNSIIRQIDIKHINFTLPIIIFNSII